MKRFLLAALVALFALPGAARAEEGEPLSKRLKKGLVGFEEDDFAAHLHGRVQLWGGWVGEDALLTNGDKMQLPGFRARRVRLGVDGRFLKEFTYELQLEIFDREKLGGPLYKAWIDYSPNHWFGARLGVDKFLFMKSDIVSSAALPHLDRPMGTLMMAPANTIGLVLYSEPWEEHLKLSVGLFNGLKRSGSSLHDGYEGVGITMGNRFEGLAIAGRIDLEPLAPVGRSMADVCKCNKLRLGLGVGGFMNGGDAPVIGGGSIATKGLSGYLQAKIAGFHLFGEFAQEWVTPHTKPTTPVSGIEVDSERYVASVSLGYVILAHTLGIAVRGELIEPHQGIDDEGDEWSVAATVNYYIVGDYVKAQLEYLHREELNGQAVENDAVIGGLLVNF
jgi:hypothetical protein